MNKKKFEVSTEHTIMIKHTVEAANKKKAMEFVAKHYRKQVPYSDPTIIFQYEDEKRFRKFFENLEDYNPSSNHLFRIEDVTEYWKCDSCAKEGFLIRGDCCRENECHDCVDKFVKSCWLYDDIYECLNCHEGVDLFTWRYIGECPYCNKTPYFE